ncbi:HPr family phosphocarrier protein [Ruminococcus gauvreauii]|uniref:HPr family phosphocarrier protein n=1 Tax=Ruminococcus gauvreauii TaxID=438033 RepID=A0ABY5VK58_9FIRM|nr:HPr family phosphocarrier protein [Ruminococcus gauvreauii]UWP60985.1 HPr family phosphocarrier protein [Ruminococcus gauvreauii]
MRNFQYVITDEVGIHARPAGLLVKKAKSFPAVITISCGGKKAEATKLMAIMGLGAKKGSEVTVTVEGEDEDAVSAEMETFFKENF